MATIFNTATLTPTTPLSPDHTDWVYNGLDCGITFEIFEQLLPQLDSTTSRTYNFSRALQAPVLEMSLRGILVDNERRQKVLTQTRSSIERLEAQLYEIIREGVGMPITNWRSPVQIKELFYDVLKLPTQRKRNAKGVYAPSVDREALEQLSTYFIGEPICRHMLTLRDLDKKRQFLEGGIDPDNRFRSNYNIAGTNTGRLASSASVFDSGSNAQNIDRELRSVFVADPGMKFANLDLEQGDSRNVGALCWHLFVESMGEKFAGSYLDACESGDLHTSVAKLVWPLMPWTGNLSDDKKLAEQIFYRQDSYRQMAKKGGHGTNYFGTARTMSKHLKTPFKIIENFQKEYFRAFPVIGNFDRDKAAVCWHNYVRQQLAAHAQLTTLFGRRRFFFGRPQDDSTLREAIAFEPQSMTADAVDTGMLRIWRAQRVQLLAQVHDSILFQFPEHLEAEIIPWALETLRAPLVLAKGREFCVPTEAKVGWNWGDASPSNVDGLVKWKGSPDTRTRTQAPIPRKLFSLGL